MQHYNPKPYYSTSTPTERYFTIQAIFPRHAQLSPLPQQWQRKVNKYKKSWRIKSTCKFLIYGMICHTV